MNQTDNKCLRVREPYGACSLLLSAAAISVVSLSAQDGMPHSCCSSGEPAWQQCPLVAAGGIGAEDAGVRPEIDSGLVNIVLVSSGSHVPDMRAEPQLLNTNILA